MAGWFFDQFVNERHYTWIHEAAYGLPRRVSLGRPTPQDESKVHELEAHISLMKEQARRVYEAVRQDLGSTLRHQQVVNRFKVRSQNYNLKALRDLVTVRESETTRFVREREHLLTIELARYLFDQGIPVLYRVRMGDREIDLVDPTAVDPLFIEAKAYKDSDSRDVVLGGITQMHSYLTSHEAYQMVTEAYYIVFRLGGPLYELPRRISTPRFTIYPVLVDLGSSEESGRRQRQSIVISAEDIHQRIAAATVIMGDNPPEDTLGSDTISKEIDAATEPPANT